MKLENQKGEVLIKVSWKSRANAAKDVESEVTRIHPKTRSKSNAAQFFLARLLLLLTGCLCFCLESSVGLTVDQTVSLASSSAVSIVGKVAIGLLG